MPSGMQRLLGKRRCTDGLCGSCGLCDQVQVVLGLRVADSDNIAYIG